MARVLEPLFRTLRNKGNRLYVYIDVDKYSLVHLNMAASPGIMKLTIALIPVCCRGIGVTAIGKMVTP